MNDQSTQHELTALLITLVPEDGSRIGNQKLKAAFDEQAKSKGHQVPDGAFEQIKESLVQQGVLVRGKGRGGSVMRAQAGDAPYSLETQDPPKHASEPSQKPAKGTKKKSSSGKKQDDGSQVLSYRYDEKRKNNPHVGMVDTHSDGVEEEKTWYYDPHLAPELQFDSARSKAESLIGEALAASEHEAEQARNELLEWLDHALAGGDEAAVREVVTNLRKRVAEKEFLQSQRESLAALKRMQEPFLNWAGKAERTSFEVDTVSLHVHERIDPATILAAVQKSIRKSKGQSSPAFQPDMFHAPFENLPMRDAIDFYKHERDWANRLIAGDSLLVMNSLLQKEGVAGQVQMIYIDPPYGIKYGSNFQPFVNKRDVKDRKDEDLTQEPEMIKAFRDTWELGVHSYLTYLRDRLQLAKELLHDSGSVFVQISDENLDFVSQVMAEIFGPKNYLNIIPFTKTSGVTTKFLASNVDFLVWYAKDKTRAKFNQLYFEKSAEAGTAKNYGWLELKGGGRRGVAKAEKNDPSLIPEDALIYKPDNIASQGNPSNPFVYQGKKYEQEWKTNAIGRTRLGRTNRLHVAKNSLQFVRYLGDFPCVAHTQLWDDMQTGSFTEDKVYAVQTAQKVIERCLLMVTDPGDLVLDPTCGSGTTAFVAEKWGRRWITTDTSRVSITLAKQRLMTASYDYYELKYPHEGLRGGFVYKTVPHITLKSIANNSEIDEIHERMHPAVEAALSDLNVSLKGESITFKVGVGGRKGGEVDFSAPDSKTIELLSGETAKANALLEWEVPFDFPKDWPEAARKAFEAFHSARQAMQQAMDESIAAHAGQEVLYDQPEVSKNKLRITGPFTVEAVPFATVLGLDEAEQPKEADVAVARSSATSRHALWREELLKAGIRGKGGQKLRLMDLETLPDTHYIHAVGTIADTGERVAVSFGPEHAALEQRQVEIAKNEAGDLFPTPKMLVFCAFTFDPEAAKDIDNIKGIQALKVQMNTDLLTEDLKKGRASNESFWLMGQPDVEVNELKDGTLQVEVHGFDYFDTKSGELIPGGKKNIALWELDTDYDDRSLYPRQVFFPMAGKKDGWYKLKKNIRAELDESRLDQFHGTKSLPFEPGDNRCIAVKIIDDRGIESLKVIRLDNQG